MEDNNVDYSNLSTANIDFTNRFHIIGVFSRTGTGKSFLIKDLLFNLKKQKQADYVFVISGTSFDKDDYGYVKRFLMNNNDLDQKIHQILRFCKLLKKKKSKKRIVLVLDDVSSSKSKFRHESIAKLYNDNRHYNLHVILGSQYACHVPPEFRNNMSICYMIHQTQLRVYKALEESFNLHGDPKEFKNMLVYYSKKKYHFVVCDKAENRYFIYTAKPHNKFVILNKTKNKKQK